VTEYEQLRAALDKKLAADPSLRAVIKRIKNGTATLTDSAEYARVLSHILGREVSANIVDLDDREGIVTQLLRDCYGDVNSIYAKTQTLLDEQAGIHIRPQQPDFPAERVDQFTHSLIDPTVAESVIKRRARAGCETITKSFHDDCIKKNAQFRHDAGLKCYIVRIGTKCCEWCSDVAGKYEFGDQPDGIFRRHDNCDCTIIYDGQVLRGRQNADGSRSKTWEELPNANAADYTAPSLSDEQGRAIEQRNLAQIRGLTSSANDGKIKSENAFNCYGDYLRDKMGSALENQPDEVRDIVDDVVRLGGSVEFLHDNTKMVCNVALGEPGQIEVDENISIGGLKHEYRHFLDDMKNGNPGLGYYLRDKDVFFEYERRGYMEELLIAEQNGYDDVADKIRGEIEKRRREIYGE